MVNDNENSDEVKYIGPLENGKRIGYGATFWRNKSSYYGRTEKKLLKNRTGFGVRKRTGFGVYIYEPNSRIKYYIGTFIKQRSPNDDKQFRVIII